MRGVFNIYDEPDSPHESACLRHMVSRNRQMRGMFSMYDEPESPNEGACSRYLMYQGHQRRGRRD